MLDHLFITLQSPWGREHLRKSKHGSQNKQKRPAPSRGRATQQTQPAFPPGPPHSMWRSPSPASPGPQRSREQPTSASPVLTAGGPSRGLQEKHPPSRLLSPSRELIQPWGYAGWMECWFLPSSTAAPRLVGHQIPADCVSDVPCLVSRPS